MKTVNACFQARSDLQKEWYVVDATDKVLGRLATRIATVLMGKHKPTYTPHVDTGDFVIVLNAGAVRVTGRKREEIVYESYSGYPGGHKIVPFERVAQRHPERIIEEAVRRMLPKSALGSRMLKKLKMYRGADHPHQAQTPTPMPL
ncbi:MAG: 50S ribosomal protein L13 [Planctomycetia bacterium]|nr:MAG: 50S ribosomal protein L13 [Planctomycetia bacterium]